MDSNDLILPPLPPLKWNEGSWEGEATLPAWAGFQSRRGPYDSQDSAEPSDGSIRVRVEVEDGHLGQNLGQKPPTPEQAAAWKYLVENQDAIRDAILAAVAAEYPEWREMFGPGEGEPDEWMPVISSTDDLKKLMGLGFVHISRTSLGGVAYVGFEMGCTWDDEHGLGALVHRDRVVEVGGADTSFLGWNAEQDANAQRGVQSDPQK